MEPITTLGLLVGGLVASMAAAVWAYSRKNPLALKDLQMVPPRQIQAQNDARTAEAFAAIQAVLPEFEDLGEHRLGGVHLGRPIRVAMVIEATHLQGGDVVPEFGALAHSVLVRAPVYAAELATLSIRRETAASEFFRMVGVEDVQIGDPILDDRLHIGDTAGPAPLAIIRHPDVQGLLHLIAMGGSASWLREGHLLIQISTLDAQRAAGLVTQVAEAVRAIDRAASAPWQAAADALALHLGDFDEHGHRAIGGTLRGVAVQVAVEADGPRTHICATLPGHVPARLQMLRAGEPLTGAPVRTHDPILDSALGICGISAEEGVALAADSALVSAAMAVLHAHAGSNVSQGQVHLRVPGKVQDGLEELIQDTASLAALIGAALA